MDDQDRTEIVLRTEMVQRLVERAQRGAAMLDDTEPGWRDRIAPSELMMKNCDQCILGQLYGRYHDYTYTEQYIEPVARFLGLVEMKNQRIWRDSLGSYYGFTHGGATFLWKVLDQVWLAIIKGEEIDVDYLSSMP